MRIAEDMTHIVVIVLTVSFVLASSVRGSVNRLKNADENLRDATSTTA